MPKTPTGSEATYHAFLPEAHALAAANVHPFRADAVLAAQNADAGAAALLAQEKRLHQELPKLDLAHVRSLPELGLAVIYAANLVDRSSDGTTKKLLAEAHQLRMLLLTAARSLATAELVPEKDVARIEAGRGPIDTAQDLVDLAALFRKHKKAAKESPVKPKHVSRADELGTELLGRLKPIGSPGKRKAPPSAVAAAADRDRLWSLLVIRYEVARRAGVWLWGEAEVDTHVPALGARHRVKHRPAKPAAAPSSATGGAGATPV